MAEIPKGHAKRMAVNRYGFNPDFTVLVKRIQAGDGELIKSISKTRKIWHVLYAGVDWVVVYDNEQQRILTCLRPEAPNPPQETE